MKIIIFAETDYNTDAEVEISEYDEDRIKFETLSLTLYINKLELKKALKILED